MAKILDLASLDAEIARLQSLGIVDLRREWSRLYRKPVPPALTKDLLWRMMAYRLQEQVFGGFDRQTKKLLDRLAQGKKPKDLPRRLKPGTVLVREYQGTRHEVMIIREGFVWRGTTYSSLSAIAGQITGTAWNGRRFFGIDRLPTRPLGAEQPAPTSTKSRERIAASVGARDANGAPVTSAKHMTYRLLRSNPLWWPRPLNPQSFLQKALDERGRRLRPDHSRVSRILRHAALSRP